MIDIIKCINNSEVGHRSGEWQGRPFEAGLSDKVSLSSRHLNEGTEWAVRMHKGRANARGNVFVVLGRWRGSQHGLNSSGGLASGLSEESELQREMGLGSGPAPSFYRRPRFPNAFSLAPTKWLTSQSSDYEVENVLERNLILIINVYKIIKIMSPGPNPSSGT